MLNFYQWLLLVAAIFCFGFCEARGSSNLTGECRQIERQALLEFKFNLTYPSSRLASWSYNDYNCCKWYGVFCHKENGYVLELNLGNPAFPEDSFVGEINPSLVKLKHLRYLDLSNNRFERIPEFLGSMGSLRYLDLHDYSEINDFYETKNIPHQLGNLSNLQYLSLGSRNSKFYTENLQWLSGLSSLKFLELDGVEVGPHSNWLKEVNILSSLEELYLISCNFLNSKTSPLINSNFSSLSILDLSDNFLNESLILSWTFELQSLTSINLADNNFQGPIPTGFQNLTSLRELVLADNNFSSSIPNWLYHLHQLKVLILFGNTFLEVHISDNFRNMTSLRVLDLSFTGLQGGIPKSFKNLCNLRSLFLSGVKLKQKVNEVLEAMHGCASKRLEDLDLTQCQLSGHLSNDILGQFKSLVRLYIGNNNINGTMPPSLGGLPKLQSVDISDNLLAGEVVELHFANLTHLKEFHADGNRLLLGVTSNWIPPFQQMIYLYLGSWLIGPQFPMWLSSLKSLVELDLSSCGISGTIPSWFSSSPTHLRYLNLSHNEIEGAFPHDPNTTFLSSLYVLDLNSNFFSGPIPSLSSTMEYLDLSNNSFSGSLSNFLCSKMLGDGTTYFLEYLNVEQNLLEGTIPDCWMNWGGLQVIEFSNNKFDGLIPESFGTLRFLLILHLRNNKLIGGIPLSLRNCTQLFSLQLDENLLMGSIPKWVGEALPNLGILILRENKFQGHMPKELCQLASLRILDVSNNNISGSIPNCINEFHAMTLTVIDPFYTYRFYMFVGKYGQLIIENARLVTKGRELEYDLNLKYVKFIDLSNNSLSGEIPIEITSLIGLEFLNLSNNHLVGRIPRGIDELKNLESLDLSENHLSGNIPQSMATLHFLCCLNLSNNNLNGRIPTSTQLQSFNASSYSGNDGLCGPPLTNSCSENGQVYIDNVTESHDIDWFYVSMTVGFVVGFGGVLGSLIFIGGWRYKFFNFLDYLESRIYYSF